MPTLSDLHQAVDQTLADKRIGTPVFVRYHVQGHLSEQAKEAEKTVLGWLGQPAKDRHELKSEKHHSSTLRTADGRSAVVSRFPGATDQPGVMLMVLGNQGAIYHHLDSTRAWVWHEEKAKPPQKPSAEKYGVLLVTGSHTHQENYAQAFKADPRCKLIAVTDEEGIDKERRMLNERLARELGVPYEPSLEKALKREDVDIVSVCAPPERRGRIALQCARAGKHLYLDKSLTPSLEEADALVKAVAEAKVRSHMFSFITQPWAQRAKALLDSGRLGKLIAIHSDTFFAKGYPGTAKLGKPRAEEYPPKRHQLKTAKRELDNVGVYPITLIAWLTGKPFRAVHGITGNHFFAEHQKHDVEDFGLLSCTLDSDIPVTLSAGRYGWRTHPNFGVNRILLIGSKETALVDANSPRLEVYADEKPWQPPNVNLDDPMGFWSSTQDAVHLQPKKAWIPFHGDARSDVSYFLDRLEAREESALSAEEAARSTEVLLAGYLSAKQEKEVKLPLAR